eukprot:scaffold61435_cov63-Phaeocystis_antarctica.AAC.3
MLLKEGMSDAEGVKLMPSEFRTLRLERRGGTVALMLVSASRTPSSASCVLPRSTTSLRCA